MEVFRLNVKHEHIRQQLPKATKYFCECIRAESCKRFYFVYFLLLSVEGPHLQRIPETFWRRPGKPAKSGSDMTLACKAGPQRDVGD